MKVAYVTSQIVGVPYSLCVIMKKLGIETVLYRRKIRNKGYGANSGNPLNVDIRYLSENHILRYMQILKINNEYDIVQLHDGGGIFEAVFCGFGKAKVIYHFHGSSIRENMPNFNIKSYIKKIYWKYLGIHSKALVSTEDLLSHWKGAELLLDPTDQTLYQKQRQINIEQPYILSSHSCDDGIKGTFKVFSAWSILKKKFPNYTLHVVNWGKDAKYYKDKTKNDSSIVWHEFIQRDEYISLLAGATVNWGEFVIPSYGLTELEAFALGVPDVTGIDITDITLAEKTEKIILDDNIRSIVLDKQKQIVLKYDPDKISKQLYNIYMGVLNVS
jgi:glycosyltransferase involved in cell wall biosynthesis